MVKVSLVIPAYNAAPVIAATLQSACGQTEPDIEILVVDDCSTDRTRDVVAELAQADRRILLLRTARNGGPSAARNVGLAHARGDWVGLLDSDDAMAPDRLARLVAFADRRQADVVADNILLVSEQDAMPPAAMIPAALLSAERRLDLTEFIEGNIGGRHSRTSYGFLKPVFRRAFLERHGLRYDENVRFAEDFRLYVRCLQAGAVWWLMPEPLYHYLVRAHSLTHQQSSGDLNRLRQGQRALLKEATAAGDARLCRAIRRHLRGVDRNYSYRAFTDAVKARAWGRAGNLLSTEPGSAWLILSEGLVQAPTILGKALRGGYAGRRRR